MWLGARLPLRVVGVESAPSECRTRVAKREHVGLSTMPRKREGDRRSTHRPLGVKAVPSRRYSRAPRLKKRFNYFGGEPK